MHGKGVLSSSYGEVGFLQKLLEKMFTYIVYLNLGRLLEVDPSFSLGLNRWWYSQRCPKWRS